MRKLKYILPVAQIVLALVLWRGADQRSQAAVAVCGSPGPDPGVELLDAISAPVMLWVPLAFYLLLSAVRLAPSVTLAIAVGLFWLWVALTVESWKVRGTVWMPRWLPLRIAGDLVLMGVGALCGLAGVIEFATVGPLRAGVGCFGWLPGARWMSATADGLHLMWCLALIFSFGRDLLLALRKSPAEAREF